MGKPYPTDMAASKRTPALHLTLNPRTSARHAGHSCGMAVTRRWG